MIEVFDVEVEKANIEEQVPDKKGVVNSILGVHRGRMKGLGPRLSEESNSSRSNSQRALGAPTLQQHIQLQNTVSALARQQTVLLQFLQNNVQHFAPGTKLPKFSPIVSNNDMASGTSVMNKNEDIVVDLGG